MRGEEFVILHHMGEGGNRRCYITLPPQTVLTSRLALIDELELPLGVTLTLAAPI